MFEKALTVKYISSRTCFIQLPVTYKVDAGKCIKLTHSISKRVSYFSVSIPNNNIEEHTLGLDSKYAKALGIQENDQVQVSEIADLPIITSLSVVPNSKEDYEVLELLADNVQNTLLEQVRVVNSNQNLIIWIGQNVWVNVTVENVQPVCPGIMTVLTEVTIKPPNENVVSKPTGNKILDSIEPQQDDSLPHKLNTFLSSFLNFTQRRSFQDEVKIPDNHHSQFLDTIFRVISLDSISQFQCSTKCSYPFNVFVSKESLGEVFSKSSVNSSLTPIFGCVTLLEPSLISVKEVYVRVCFLEDFYNFKDTVKLSAENMFVSSVVINYLECSLGTRVVLKQIETKPQVHEIEIHSKKNYLEDIVEKLKLYLASNSLSPYVLNPDIPMVIEKNFICSVKFLPDFPKYCIVDETFLRNCKYSIHNEFITIKEQSLKTEDNREDILNVSNFGTIIENAIISFTSKQLENVLITGKPGTGKTILVNNISLQLSKYPSLIYPETISCRKVKGKTLESLSKMFTLTVSKLILCQPSVLILEDLHVLCENCQGEETPNSLYFNRISEMLHNFLKVICKCNSIGVLATSESTSKLNKHIYRSRGSHLFKNHYSIAELTKSDRKTLLKQMFNQHKYENINFDDLSLKTEGFVVQDIVDFFNKAVFESYKEDTKLTILESHCEKALKNTCVLSLQNVQLQTSGMKSFDDVGGLHHVKDVLVESLLWPAQYPTIFGDAPLRLQSGLLLYGPPGTGKTLLAGAAARHCGLRLISIKGPELLSKYIGASEQAVRDVFEKAQSARPCILFFDEFDSLAPRRGHDNTGVTDRVVNQLLTQLDGVESLSGVCVLAATSRPDLLDPALLRPGRLDRQLLCPLPNKKERLEVLEVLSKNLDMAADIRLEDVAELTEGYSGADLQSILYTAQLSSVNYLFESEKEEIIDSEITQDHLMEAVNKTRPSLTRSERLKYDRIYTKFQGGVLEDFKAGSKATLA